MEGVLNIASNLRRLGCVKLWEWGKTDTGAELNKAGGLLVSLSIPVDRRRGPMGLWTSLGAGFEGLYISSNVCGTDSWIEHRCSDARYATRQDEIEG